MHEADDAARSKEKRMVGNASDASTSPGPENNITVIAWETDDRENPYNFSRTRKQFIVFVCVITILNATLGSSLPSNVVSKLSEEWGIESTYQEILPISVYIIGKRSLQRNC